MAGLHVPWDVSMIKYVAIKIPIPWIKLISKT